MNGKALLTGLLVLALAVPAAVAADPPSEAQGHSMSPEAKILAGPTPPDWFGPDPSYPQPYDPQEQLNIYGNRHAIRTKFPPVNFGLRLYDYGAYTPRPTLLGVKNPIMSAFMAYGDLRVAGTHTRGGKADDSAVAARLNVDMDWQFTPTERIHAFVRPLDKGGLATRYQFNGGSSQDKFVRETNFTLKTLFFEGDIGAINAGLTGKDNTRDIPFAVGRVPIFTQNGVWIDDAIDGASFNLLTAKNNPALDISNFDITVFAGFHNVTTPAIAATDKSAKLLGVASFLDLLGGYSELGYGYLNDGDNRDSSYHNVTAAFSRRYMGRIANSIRVIGNFGQKTPVKTADGVLLLLENSFIRGNYTTINPLTFVPYFNFFAGFKSPQSLARAADAGGVLKNTGINFETDGLTGYPTIDATAHDTYGGALGLEYLFNLDRQIIFEVARVEDRNNSLPGNQTAVGARYQHPLCGLWIVRLDAMKGWRQGLTDIYGARLEFRRKF